jgi:glycosyltransferase involved in cell wall biosynthesis
MMNASGAIALASTPFSCVRLIEPDAGGRISGGYLYNRRITEGLSQVQRHACRPRVLAETLAALPSEQPLLVLLDSLFFHPDHMATFLEWRQRGDVRLGVLMHALPSFVERAMDRQLLCASLPLAPTPTELALLDRLDVLVAPGPYVPRVVGEAGCAISCLVCPPGIDRSPAPRPAERPPHTPVRVLSIGHITPLKGFLDGVAALAPLADLAWDWSIVGDASLAPQHVAALEAEAERAGILGRVHLLGPKSHADTLEELRQSDLLLLPSYTENCPLVALEALSAHVPVVGYAVGGLPDLVHHDETGLLAPLLDVTALSGQLRRLLGEAPLRQRLSDGCLDAASGLLTWSDAARNFERQLSLWLIQS